MMPERAQQVEETERDDDLRQEQMSDPAVQERLRRIFEDAKNGVSGPGITAEELPDFLREHGS